jgi:beta-glucosidase
VAVIGEKPYAEMQGDRKELNLAPEDVATVDNLKATGVPVVVVVVSGRPLVLGSVAEKANALVAAWLPGTEGNGVADVLFGDFKPTGKLTFSWPRTTAQIGVHQGDAGYDPLYKYGYGLSY